MRQGDESAGLMPSDLTRLDYYNEWRANQRWIEEFEVMVLGKDGTREEAEGAEEDEKKL